MIKSILGNAKNENGVSIAWAVGTVVAISLSLVAVAFIAFLNSGAYTTVKQISAASNTLQKDDLDGYDTTSPIRADILGDYMNGIDEKVISLDDEQDFKQDLLNKEDLGY